MLMSVLTGISALALVFNSSLFSGEKRKTATGTIVKTSAGAIVLEYGDQTLLLEVTPETSVHLNERSIDLSQVQSGRKANVVFTKSKAKLVAQKVDVFPVPEDFTSHSDFAG